MSDPKKTDSSNTNSDNLSSTTSSACYQPVPNTPTQKGKVKTPKYLRNASIKLLTHPVDKNIAWSFLLSVIFAAISVLTGFPTVIMLMWILGIALGLRIFFAGCCGYRRNTRVRDIEALPENPRRSSWLRPDNFVRPPEALWLHDTSFNLHISHCLFFLDPGLNSAKLQDMVRTRVLNKTTQQGERAFPRFLQKIVPVCSGYCWVDDEEFSIENHIYDEQQDISNAQSLEDHINTLMCEPLSMSRPLWEIRLIKDFGRCKDTVLIVRIHQAVSDAITLILILGNFLSDNQHILRLKTRFGSATYFLNLFRALFVAPLTFLGWLIFKPRDYNFFNRHHKPSTRVVAWSHNIKYSKVLRIKQVMRCSLNDVFVSAVSGAVRAYFTKNGIRNPPNVTVSIFYLSIIYIRIVFVIK